MGLPVPSAISDDTAASWIVPPEFLYVVELIHADADPSPMALDHTQIRDVHPDRHTRATDVGALYHLGRASGARALVGSHTALRHASLG